MLSDVTNQLCGPVGAAAVFGPQKGLHAEAVAVADAALARFAGLVAPGAAPLSPAASFDTSDAERAPSRRARPLRTDHSAPARQHPAHSAHVWDAGTPGAGAAGGTGFGLLAWGAELVRGAERVAELIHLAEAIAGADLVITGEGSYDGQSAAGKVPAFVAQLTSASGVPAALVAGRITADADTSAFAASVSLTELAGSPEASVAAPADWLRAAGAQLARAR